MLEDFGISIRVAQLQNCDFMLFVYLLGCRNILILADLYFRFIKVNFQFTNTEGKRRKLSFPSTFDKFRSTFRPHDTHPLHYDAMNELK